MISRNDNPIEWAGLCTELEDAAEHLASLVSEMTQSGDIDEIDFAIQLGHVYAHLNRAWNTKRLERDITGEEWQAYSQFPTDLEPVG